MYKLVFNALCIVIYTLYVYEYCIGTYVLIMDMCNIFLVLNRTQPGKRVKSPFSTNILAFRDASYVYPP